MGEIQGKNCLTDFHGMSITRDKMCYLVKKKHTLIEVEANCKTTDGYVVRVFVIAFTKRVQDHQVKQFCYAQTRRSERSASAWCRFSSPRLERASSTTWSR